MENAAGGKRGDSGRQISRSRGKGPPARGFGRQDLLAEEPEVAGWGWGICRFGFGGIASRSIGFDGGKTMYTKTMYTNFFCDNRVSFTVKCQDYNHRLE
jgi:hypothetical protein